MASKGFENYDMNWLSKNHPEEAKKIFGGSTSKERSCAQQPEKHLKRENKGKDFIEFALISKNIKYSKEYQFAPPRKFRFDFAFFCSWYGIPNKKVKVGIEYEGLIFEANRQHSTGTSGHTTIKGFTSNCEKYNLAQLDGWIVLRYTALNFKTFSQDLQKILS